MGSPKDEERGARALAAAVLFARVPKDNGQEETRCERKALIEAMQDRTPRTWVEQQREAKDPQLDPAPRSQLNVLNLAALDRRDPGHARTRFDRRSRIGRNCDFHVTR